MPRRRPDLDNSFRPFLLPRELVLALEAHCRLTGEDPSAVVRDAVTLHLDEAGERYHLDAPLCSLLPVVDL